ncbi:MAG TPA: ABC transporter permease [Lichenihabitans sp.]|nr:ABC transporter permease [Lichenihabitans sp.]
MPAFALLVLMFAIYASRDASALTVFGFGNLINNAIVLAVAASGLTLVVLSGEFDLSGSGVVAIANVVVATTSTGRLGSLGSFAVVLVIGLAVGAINGCLVTVFGLQSLAVTIGSLIVCQGIALMILGAPGGDVADAIASGVTGDVGGIPIAAIIVLGVAAAWLVLKNTREGIGLYAVGDDEIAARLSGLDVRRTRFLAFTAAGLLYAVAGYLFSAEIGSGDPRISDSFLLYIFASVAIGGTSLTGGRGGVLGSLIGAGILTVMQKMLFALGVAEFYTNIFNGIIMVVAIFFGQIGPLLFRLGRPRAA